MRVMHGSPVAFPSEVVWKYTIEQESAEAQRRKLIICNRSSEHTPLFIQSFDDSATLRPPVKFPFQALSQSFPQLHPLHG